MIKVLQVIHWLMAAVYGALLALFWLWLSGKVKDHD